LASADEKLRTFFLDHTLFAINKEMNLNNSVNVSNSYSDELSDSVTNTFNVEDGKVLL
jgi:hypothetical protein